MTTKERIHNGCIILLLCFMQTAGIAVYGQNHPRAAEKRMHHQEKSDSLHNSKQVATLQIDSLITKEGVYQQQMHSDSITVSDSIALENKKKLLEMTGRPLPKIAPAPIDSIRRKLNDKKKWIPSSAKATWLALVIPGGGQIYNHKYWKLPIIYGGFAGCAYALTWNNKMYKDYSQAYKDASNGNIKASSITDLLPAGYASKLTESQLTTIIKNQKDRYRRYRDLSIFSFIGVYLISVIDAYVDAELSNFDITPDLSMRVEPAIINNQAGNNYSKRSVGVQCSLQF